MEKPTIFLSHSSRDSESLKRLQAMLEKATSGTLSLFLSSDGQSIPFGRNWVATVEQALDSSALMFSFLSPVSTGSAWINFEAGYAYARGVKVVPVAIMGKDLNALNPPLSLLQGFNLKSHEGMNNILSVINATFSTSYPLSFNEDDYAGLFPAREKAATESFGSAAPYVTRVTMEILADEKAWESLRGEVIRQHGSVFSDGSKFAVSGLEVRKYVSEKGQAIEISVSPAHFNLHIPFLKLCAELAFVGNERVFVRLDQRAEISADMWEITGRLHDTPVKPVDNKFMFEEVVFEFAVVGVRGSRYAEDDICPIWAIAFDAAALAFPQTIRRLLDLLVKHVILEEDEIPF
ncbi:MAG: toll/interleukin-1 receptor domain-containing protein [Verrucomicrobia bacterium]|nr:toll/interleukin-1 receptor domain-containing protein [Verrucomicrobiota bacterium]